MAGDPSELREGERVYTDGSGREYVLDERGNRRPPMRSHRDSPVGEFTTFATNQGHCGLCGSLACRGNCFK